MDHAWNSRLSLDCLKIARRSWPPRRVNEVSTDIIRRCQQGDIAALEEVYRAYGQRVYRLCLRMMGEPADAEDAAQQVFLRLFDQACKFSGQSAFSTWIYRVAANHCLNALKRRQSNPAVSLSDAPEALLPSGAVPSPDEAAAATDDWEVASRLLGALGLEDRAIIVLREIEGLAYQQIAYVLDIPTGTVMSRLHRARSRLGALAARFQRDAEGRRE